MTDDQPRGKYAQWAVDTFGVPTANTYVARRVNRTILWLIVLAVVLTVIETVPAFTADYGRIIATLQWGIVVVFTLEYPVRFWAMTQTVPTYGGPRGALRYLFSAGSVIDLGAVLPAYLGLLFADDLTFLAVLRLFRVLRIGRYMSGSLRLLVRGMKRTSHEMLVSLQVVAILTVISSVLLYYVESSANPNAEFSDVPMALLWAFSKFIGDIAGYGDFTPVTVVGQVIATFVGVLTIAIVAVPSGILASGFVDEIAQAQVAERRSAQLSTLSAAFVEHPVPVLQCKVRRGMLNARSVCVGLGISESELFALVNESPGFRLRPRASRLGLTQPDMIAVERFDQSTEYGHIRVNESKLWIVSPDSCGQQSIGWFAETLARTLGASYISNELYGDAIYKHDEAFGNAGLVEATACEFKRNEGYLSEEADVPAGFVDWKRDIAEHMCRESIAVVVRTCSARHGAAFMVQNGGKRGHEDVERKLSTVECPDSLSIMVRRLDSRTREEFHEPTLTHSSLGSSDKRNIIHFIRDVTGADTILVYVHVDRVCHGESVKVIAMLRDALRDWVQSLRSE